MFSREDALKKIPGNSSRDATIFVYSIVNLILPNTETFSIHNGKFNASNFYQTTTEVSMKICAAPLLSGAALFALAPLLAC